MNVVVSYFGVPSSVPDETDGPLQRFPGLRQYAVSELHARHATAEVGRCISVCHIRYQLQTWYEAEVKPFTILLPQTLVKKWR